MKVLIACECSGRVRRAFRGRGIEAWSNDIKPADDASPWHIQGDCIDAMLNDEWDLIIAHPDCTAMAVSGNRWYGKGQPMHAQREEAVEWTMRLWSIMKSRSLACALENPVSVIFNHLDAPVHYIQPWQFGHGETKKTGFALHNLPPLTPTDIVPGREQRIWKMPPGPGRKAMRSETFLGVADAIAAQWSAHVAEIHGVYWLGDTNYHIHKKVYGK